MRTFAHYLITSLVVLILSLVPFQGVIYPDDNLPTPTAMLNEPPLPPDAYPAPGGGDPYPSPDELAEWLPTPTGTPSKEHPTRTPTKSLPPSYTPRAPTPTEITPTSPPPETPLTPTAVATRTPTKKAPPPSASPPVDTAYPPPETVTSQPSETPTPTPTATTIGQPPSNPDPSPTALAPTGIGTHDGIGFDDVAVVVSILLLVIGAIRLARKVFKI